MLVCCIACEHKRICFMLRTCVEYEIPNTKVSECMNQIFIFFGWKVGYYFQLFRFRLWEATIQFAYIV